MFGGVTHPELPPGHRILLQADYIIIIPFTDIAPLKTISNQVKSNKAVSSRHFWAADYTFGHDLQ